GIAPGFRGFMRRREARPPPSPFIDLWPDHLPRRGPFFRSRLFAFADLPEHFPANDDTFPPPERDLAKRPRSYSSTPQTIATACPHIMAPRTPKGRAGSAFDRTGTTLMK